MTEIKLGDRVTDRVTGLTGIAVARVLYLNGCVQYCVQPKNAIDALKTDSLYIDKGQLRWVDHGINEAPVRKTKSKARKQRARRGYGGPSAHAPKGIGR